MHEWIDDGVKHCDMIPFGLINGGLFCFFLSDMLIHLPDYLRDIF